MCTGFGDDLKGASHLVRKLFRQTSDTKELSADIGLGSNRKFWSWQVVSISILLLILLCGSHVLLQHSMKSIKIQCEFMSAGMSHSG
jgi:hypothetical protein